MTDADKSDNLALLANTSIKAESLLHRLEQAAWGIGFHLNANKTELMCFKQDWNISTKWQASEISEQVRIRRH